MNTVAYGRQTTRNEGVDASPSLFGRIRTFLSKSRAERQLSQLDDRMLADIGLKRSEIHRMVWGN